jgi:N-formylglutamate deformylase
MILHIPHSSTDTLNYAIHNKELEVLRMTDHFTGDLYTCKNATRVVFGVSRLICDVERFEHDDQEIMSHYGMGVCYTQNAEGQKLRDVSPDERHYIVEHYYRPHHQRLTDAVDIELSKGDSALIIDCHSFPDTAYYFNQDFEKKRTDICIGTDKFHTPKVLLEITKKFFLSKGYTVSVDYPYFGTIVPLKHYKKDKRVSSIMIEVNRKLYMDEDGFKTEHYDDLKVELNELLIRIYDDNRRS